DIPKRMGTAHPSVVPYQAFKTKDRDVIIAAANNKLFFKICERLEWKDILESSKYQTNALRVENRNSLIKKMAERIKKYESEHLIKILTEVGVPVGPIHTIDEITKDEQVSHRNMIPRIPHPKIKNLKVPGIPYKLSKTPPSIRRHPPLLGEHTREVLTELGYSEETIKELRHLNAI